MSILVAVLRALRLDVAPRPIEIARALAALDPAVALLHAAAPGAASWQRRSFVGALADRTSSALDPLEGDPDPLLSSGDAWASVPRWIGVLPYEACRARLERSSWSGPENRPLPHVARAAWARHRVIVCIDHRDGVVHAVSTDPALLEHARAAVERPAEPPVPLIVSVEDAEPVSEHIERVAAARELILRGDLYQVNLARPLRLHAAGRSSFLGAHERLELHSRLARTAPSALASCLVTAEGIAVVSTSPELLLAATARGDGGLARLLTIPIKGTRPRGADAVSDAALAAELDADPKERAELAMIVDVERNDLGRVATPGSVRLAAPPHVVTHRTIHHRQAVLVAEARAGASRADVIAAMLPSGSVTGAPKVRAMEVIAGLESRRRGLYTGAIGHVAHDGSLVLAMAIRTATVRADGEGEYLTGGGIVADSDPAREAEETRWKSIQLERAVAPM